MKTFRRPDERRVRCHVLGFFRFCGALDVMYTASRALRNPLQPFPFPAFLFLVSPVQKIVQFVDV